MKRLILILLWTSGIFWPATGNVQENFRAFKTPYRLPYSPAKSAYITESASAGETDIYYQRMEWSIDPAVRYITGKVTTYFKVLAGKTDRMVFDLTHTLLVDSVLSHNMKVVFSHTGDQIVIPYPDRLTKGETDSVSVYYHGIPADTGMDSFVASKHNNIPVIWTLSEPYGAYEWWPCKQSLVDKTDSADIIVTSPEAYRTASNGVLASDRIVNGKRTMHWKHRYPIAPYLVAIAVTNYSVYNDTVKLGNGRIIPVVNYVYPENLQTARTQTPLAVEAIKLYNRYFGFYPFAGEKYGHAQFGWGGGMEHQTMSFMTNFGFTLIVHELSHSWFGNCLTLSSWHDIWLNEGFATFAEGFAYEKLNNGKNWNQWLMNELNYVVSSPGGAVFVEDTTDINRIFNGRLSYAKGGYLLRMMRWYTGDSLFFKALQDYFADNRLQYRFVANQDWISHLEAASGTSFSEFFRDWYYGEGYPVYSAVFRNTGKNRLQIMLSQTTSHSSVSFFEMPVPVRVYSEGRKDSADLRLDHKMNNQLFDIDVPFTVAQMSIDPDLWLVRKIDKISNAGDLDLAGQGIVVVLNPSGGKWTLLTRNGESVENAEVFDLSGRLLFQQEFKHNTLTLPWLDQGIYILRATTNRGVFKTKLVKN